MSLKHVPIRATPFSFLCEVDFPKFAEMLSDQGDGKRRFVRPAGRESEVEDIRLALFSSGANSVWLEGEEGVGKTSVISGLLQKIAHKEVTAYLLSKRVFVFNAHNFFKGDAKASFRDFDRAMQHMIQSNGLLVFDRFDDFIRTAGNDASYFANAMVDALSEGHLQAIVTSQTKNNEFVEKVSTALAPSFVKQTIQPPSKENVLAILRAQRPRLEHIHDVIVPEETIQECVRVLNDYPGRAFTEAWPQGPLNVLDKACSYVRMVRYGLAPDIALKTEKIHQLEDEYKALLAVSQAPRKRTEDIQTEINALRADIDPAHAAWEAKYKPYNDTLNKIANVEKEISVIEQRAKPPASPSGDPEKDAPELTPSDRMKLNAQMELLERHHKDADRIYKTLNPEKPVVTRADVQSVFGRASGISMSTLSGDQRTRLLNAEFEMAKYVFGQRRALGLIANVLRDARAGVADPSRPAGTILLVGPTGVGKTEVAKVLAVVDGGEGAKPIIIKMNQFQDESAESTFKGAAPGLVGFDPNGSPTLQKVRKNPRSVTDFDEFEKAHESMSDVTMQILDEGEIEDAASNLTSFKDTIVLMTSNVLLPEDIEKMPGAENLDWDDQDAVQDILREALKAKINPRTGRPFFKAEFVERIDLIIMFENTTQDAAYSIFRRQIDNQNKTLGGRNYRLEADDDTVHAIVDRYFRPGGNGRTVRQFYNRLVRSQISRFVLSDNNPPGDDELRTIYVAYDGQAVKLQGINPHEDHLPELPFAVMAANLPTHTQAGLAGGPQ